MRQAANTHFLMPRILTLRLAILRGKETLMKHQVSVVLKSITFIPTGWLAMNSAFGVLHLCNLLSMMRQDVSICILLTSFDCAPAQKSSASHIQHTAE